jgi:hypothetical protein
MEFTTGKRSLEVESSPWNFVPKMSVELAGWEMYLIESVLDSQIEVEKRKLERLGIVDDARENERKIRLNKEKRKIRPWMNENEKEMGWRGMISICNQMKMKLLNYAILYIFVRNFYGQATIP